MGEEIEEGLDDPPIPDGTLVLVTFNLPSVIPALGVAVHKGARYEAVAFHGESHRSIAVNGRSIPLAWKSEPSKYTVFADGRFHAVRPIDITIISHVH